MKIKRFLSIVLTLAMLLGMFPGMSLTASAADTTTTITSPATTGTMTITLTIAAASVKTAPEANTLTYSGSAQTLTTTGEAGVGTLQYQLGESATTEPTGTWGTTVPQGTEAKDYYVWYRSRVNDNNISTAGCKTVTIAKASITNATVTLSDTSLVYNGSEQSVTVSSVKLGDTTLTADTDYEVTSGTTGTAKNTYTVTVTGKGNYKDTATAQWSIGLATPTIKTIPTASAITYGQKLADSTLTGGAAKLGDTTVAGTFAWKNTETKPAVSDSNATEYDVVFTPTDTDNYAAVECKVKLTVNKAAPTVTAPTAKTLTYIGSAQELVNAGSTEDGTLYYAVTTENKAPTDENLYTTSIPTATNAGTYYVWYKAVGDDDHIDTIPAAVTVTVGKADLDLSVSLEGWAYGAEANTPEVTGNTGKGTVTYIYKAKDADDKNYSDAVPTAAGTYTVKATVAETDNYNAGTATADFTISKEDGPSDKDEFVVTKAPTAKTLTYTGSVQELVTAGTATGGEMQYALGTATEATHPYTTFIPSATNAGTYYVWYRVVGDGFESSAGCVTVVINEEEKLKPGDIVVSEGDLVSEPVAETKYVTAEATVNGEKLSVTISENFVNAIAYTGKKIDAVAHLSMSIDKTPIVSRFKIVDGSSVKPEDLIKVSYVQKYNKRANAAKKSKPTVYARIKVSKDAKKALSREDYKSLKKLVKKLNRELKKNPFNYRINQRSVTACEVKVVAKHGADGKIIVKNGKISGVKKVIVSIDVKDPKTGEITKNTFKLSKKEYSISDPDPENGTVRLTGKRNFTGTVTVKVE